MALVALLTVGSFAAFRVVAIGYGCCQSGLGAVRQALLAALAPGGQPTTIRARLQVGQNAGLAVGAAIGGAALALHSPAVYRLVLGVNAAAFLTAAILLRTLGPVAIVRPAAGRRLAVLSDRRYAVLAGLNAIMLLYMPLLSVALPLVAGRAHGSSRLAGVGPVHRQTPSPSCSARSTSPDASAIS